MKQPHKHADIIKAWADGAEIEFFASHLQEWKPIGANPQWFESTSFRIKPEPKPDVVRYACMEFDLCSPFTQARVWAVKQSNLYPDTSQIKLTFDGETGKLKSAEVL